MTAPAEVVSGTVRVVKNQGFQLAGREGWLNISRFAEPKPELPEVGQQVSAQLDAKGFVRTLSPMGDAPEVPTTSSSLPVALARASRPASRPGVTLSLRVHALQAAAAFLTPRSAATVDDVEQLAERFEAWLGR